MGTRVHVHTHAHTHGLPLRAPDKEALQAINCVTDAVLGFPGQVSACFLKALESGEESHVSSGGKAPFRGLNSSSEPVLVCRG